jgi:hypothetical protein
MMTRFPFAFVVGVALASAACVSDEVTPDEELGEATSALMRGDNLTESGIDKNVVVGSAVQYGLSWSAREESNSWNWSWGSGRSGMSSSEFDWYGINAYCTSYSWFNRCNSSRDTWFITPGWGANFQYYWGQQGPAGWSTFGQHPYWCPNTGGTWQGWSTAGHC